ncbi:hypothetical protein D3C77_595570 [compost metagenome]
MSGLFPCIPANSVVSVLCNRMSLGGIIPSPIYNFFEFGGQLGFHCISFFLAQFAFGSSLVDMIGYDYR